MTHDFLIEIGTEEIPARFLKSLSADFKKQLEGELKSSRLTHGTITEFATPRRLALYVQDLAEKQADLHQELKGPKISIAYDAKGELTPAGLGFAKKNNIDPKLIQKKVIGSDEILFYEKNEKGKSTSEVLGAVLTEALKKLYLPVAMRWGSEKTQFYRPVQWILALLDEKVLPFKFAGQTAGNISMGHRFLKPGALVVKKASDYEKNLEQAGVMVSLEKRKQKIAAELKSQKLETINENLLEEVSALTEFPTVVKGTFDKKYLEVPKECLITTMQKNQKYFPLEIKGALTNEFLIAADGVTDKNIENIKIGNAKVVTARLEDARFYFLEDSKNKLENLNENLKTVVFQEKLGTVYQKVERIQKIVQILADAFKISGTDLTNAKRAAILCKADLASKMVYEFPNLQGIMGEKYALAQGENVVVSKAIFEHYLPRFAGDELPTTIVGALVAMADKLDTLCGCYFAGLIPTSSQDPYALRRGAQGIVQMLLKFNLEASVTELLSSCLALFGNKDQKLAATIGEFIYGRLKQSLKDQSVDYDILEAVFAVNHQSFLTTAYLCKLFQTHRQEKWFVPLIDTAVRVNNILDPKINSEVDEKLLNMTEEKNVFAVLDKNIKAMQKGVLEKQTETVIGSLKNLVEPVGQFFEKVLVNDKDEKIKKNRMALVKKVSDFYRQVAAFEKIVVSK